MGSVTNPSGGGGSSSLIVTDGINTVTGTTQITFSGGTVSGSTPNATVTISGGGSPAFNNITSGTNTSAAMVVGSGASLSTTGTGSIMATTATSASGLNGTALSGLATGLLKNTTGTGVPSIAVAGTDYPAINAGTTGQYVSAEYNIGNASGSATVNWNNGNVQYVTMTSATTFTFTNPIAGGRYLLHMAGAYIPTFPGSIRWRSGITPAPTAQVGKKDIYTFVYSGVEGLYSGSANLNYATT